MATILTKRSNTASSVPSAAALTNSSSGAELAVNTADKRLFVKDSGGAVQEVGTNPSSLNVVGNATVGGTLGVTGVATLTANPVLSGGTANGVPYLNGSKVLTSGSALTFNGADFSNTAGKIISGGDLRASQAGSGNVGLNIVRSGGTASDWYNYIPAGSSDLAWYNSGELMRLNGTGLGIGTSTLQGKLTVQGDVYTRGGGVYYVQNSDNTNNYYLQNSGATGAANGNLNFVQGGVAVRATLDAFGNLGLGVTPSAWVSGWKALDVSGRTALAEGSSNTELSNNVYFNGSNYIYKATANATLMRFLSSGGIQWFTAPSGTAGAAITFTQAMTLDASGNLGVGTSSPSLKLNVVGADAARFENTSNGAVNVYWKNTTQQYSYRLDPNNNGSRDFSIYDDTNSQFVDKYFQGASGYRAFYTNGSERARIDSSGNFIHQVNGTAPTLSTNGTMSFELTSNTSLKIVVRGSDGVTRSATLTLS